MNINVMRVFCLILFSLLIQPAFVGANASDKTLASEIPKFCYIHVGIDGNFFVVSSSDIEDIVKPFDIGAVNFGYSYYIQAGFQNIMQIGYRCGREKNTLAYDKGFTSEGEIDRTSIDMKFKSSEWLFKFNPLFSAKDLRGWAFFLVFGMGNIEFLDKADDGFKDGKKSIYGIEASCISKFVEYGASIEKHNMTFKRFSIKGFEPLEGDIDASFWQFNLKLAIGLGI